jgi:pimeloyl-ACP methyl ester carboxylesterase
MVGPWFAQYEREVDEGRLAAAMVTLIKSDLGIETRLKVLPRFLLERLFRLAIAEDATKADDDRVPLGKIIPTFRYDAHVVEEISKRVVDLVSINTEVLLLSGTRSPTYLRAITTYLAERLPRARRVDLSDVGHLAADDDGKPSRVAEELIRFFR